MKTKLAVRCEEKAKPLRVALRELGAEPLIERMNFRNGLVPMVVQDAGTGRVISLFYADGEALRRTIETCTVWRYSRSQGKLMQKGATSGNVQQVVDIAPDCEWNSLLVRVRPAGPGCHTGAFSCYDAIGVYAADARGR